MILMRSRKLLHGWLPQATRLPARESLHSVECMQAILNRERLRSDRGTSRFSLLTLTFSKRWDKRHLRTLARVLGERIRATDDAGVLDARRIGVLLPETPAAGAWKLAQDICGLLPWEMRAPNIDVYVYPTHQSQDDPDQGTPENRAGDERDAAFTQRDLDLPARPMRRLFVRPLPLWKRTIDIVAAGSALLLLSPLLILIAAAIKITSRGPVLFVQQRTGLAGREFWIYKFRTMMVNADAMKAKLRSISEQDGPAFKLKNDPRVTPIGRLLRRTCIDELPQLMNVLKGEMSLVGPRPLPAGEAEHCNQWQQQRLDVMPGLTCIWQVHGGTKVTFTEWMRMDLRYVRGRSLWKDFQLMALTVPSVIKRNGVY